MSVSSPPAAGAAADASLGARLAYYMNPVDRRYEDLRTGHLGLNILRDMMAGLIVAMVAIPLAMGFAMASGLRPEQGIVGGAVAGAIGALFGGSKYQVYGPTAAFIPIIAGIMTKHGYPMLVLASILAGLVLMVMGLARLGRLVARVPHSIVVGFTLGIAVVIALSQVGEVLGLHASLGHAVTDKIRGIVAHGHETNVHAVIIALLTFAISKTLIRVSVFIPAPLIAVGAGTLLAQGVWSDKGLVTVREKYGSIPTDFWVFTPPQGINPTPAVLGDLAFYTLAIIFVAAIESLLCSRMADRLAGNKGTPCNPDKELWGQGLVQVVVPLLNGFPHTGALARTATNIRLGALSPLAGLFKCVLKLLLAVFLASWLERVPMACIGGILLYVASGMVKAEEVRALVRDGRAHTVLAAWTAVMVVATDFLKGVLSALLIFVLFRRFFETGFQAAPPASAS